MTCTVGLLDKKEDCIFIGADSLASTWYYQMKIKNRKVFKAKDNDNILMAVSGDPKLQNILSVECGLVDEITHLKGEVNFEYIVKHTSQKILELAKKYECATITNSYSTIGSEIIFAYKNQLYIIQNNCQVIEPADDYVVSGSGGDFAIAVLSQNSNKNTIERITEALCSAEKHGLAIQRPFYIMNTKNNDVVDI